MAADETTPGEAAPDEATPGVRAPGEAASREATPGGTARGGTAPGEAAPDETAPAVPRLGTSSSWVRIRLRSAPAAALALGVLVLVTAFLATALPLAVDRYEDTALRHAVRDAPLRDRGVTLTSSYDPATADVESDPLLPSSVELFEHEFQRMVKPPLRLLPDQVVRGVRTGDESAVTDPELPRTSVNPPAADLVAQAGLAGQVRMAAGRLPHALSEGQTSLSLEGVVSERTAQVLHLKVGQSVHLMGLGPDPVTVRVTGIVTPLHPSDPYWNEDSDLLAPHLTSPPVVPPDEPKTYWHFALLVDPTAADSMPALGSGANLYWHHPLDASRLSAHDVGSLQRQLSSLTDGPDSVALQKATDITSHVDGGLGFVLDTYGKDRAAAKPMVLIAGVGSGTTALAVLLMAGGLAAERRRGEIALLRSRGGSLRGILRRLTGETAVVAVPAGAAGTLLAVALLPTGRYRLAVLLGALFTFVGVLALPLRATAAARRPRPAAREDLTAARPSRRRLVVELTLTVLVAGAVVALRRRGTDGGSDPYLAAAPVLVAIAAALVLLRLYPLPLRLLARPAARLTGAVTHLGLARAGRSPATGQLPLLALLVSLTVVSFGGSVLAGVDHARNRAASVTVGADARIDGRFGLPAQLPDRVRKMAGVGEVTTARLEPNSPTTAVGIPFSLVIVDPDAYAKLTRAIGLPAFPVSAFTGYDGRGPLPAVVSPLVAEALGGERTAISTGVGVSDVQAAAQLTMTPAAPGADFMIVSARQLDAQHPESAKFSQNTDPTVVLAMAAPGRHIDTAALHALAKKSGPYATALLRGEQRAALADSPLQRGARGIYLAAVAAGAGYSALALLLSLLQAAPGRATLLARLRTMGMTRRQSRRLILLEALPQALLASLGGVLVGLAVIPLLRPGVDLRALTFGTGRQDVNPDSLELGLRADPWSLALPSAGLLILAFVVLLAQVWVSGRRRESTELRVGDRV